MASNVADLGVDKTADTRLDDPVAAEKGSLHGVSTGVICTSEDVSRFPDLMSWSQDPCRLPTGRHDCDELTLTRQCLVL